MGEAATHLAERKALQEASSIVDRQLANLTGLRLRDLLSDMEFVAERHRLDRERLRLVEALQTHDRAQAWFEPARQLISFNAEAAFRFRTGDRETKRLILQLVGSNPALKDRKLLLEPKKPFRHWPPKADVSLVWTYGESNPNLIHAMDPFYH